MFYQKRPGYDGMETVGYCTAVGMNDRAYQIQAVNCEKEVADIVCQPN